MDGACACGQRLREKRTSAQDPILRQIAAVSVGIVNGRRLLDLCYAEDARAEVDMNVVMTADGEFIEVQGTAEGKPFDEKRLLDMLGAGAGRLPEIDAPSARGDSPGGRLGMTPWRRHPAPPARRSAAR